MKTILRISGSILCLALLAAPAAAQETVTDAVCVDTNVGEFCIRLFREDAPRTVENFLNYVNDGHYNDTLIHRSEPSYVIQGGGFKSNPLGEEVPQNPRVRNEFKRSNVRGTLAMAKLSGDPDSATNEWFVNVGDNIGLDSQNGGFTVFAEVISGMSVVDRINRLPRINLGSQLGGAFQAVPRSQGTGQVELEDLVLVHRVYVTDAVVEEEEEEEEPDEEPEEEHPDFEAVTELRTSVFRAPVRVDDGQVIAMTFDLKSTPPSYVFEVDVRNMVLVHNPPAETAVLDWEAGTLTLPSIRANGKVYVDLVFRLTDPSILQFTLESATRL